MRVEEFRPAELLRPYIKAYRVIESQDELVNRVVPDTPMAIAFRLRGCISYLQDARKTVLPTTVFSGLQKSVRLINYEPQTASLIVLFREMGVPAFFKIQSHELFGESTPLSDILSESLVREVEEQLSIAASNVERISIVEEFFLSIFSDYKVDKLIMESVSRIYSCNGTVRIQKLATGLHISQDAFEKRFRKTIGATPKQFSSIVRMKSILQKINRSSYADLAFGNGYYDQAHFNKEFKLFTGLSPTDLLRSSYW